MATLEITQVYLDPTQKKALQERARKRGSKMSEEIRNAIEAYLEGVSVEELRMLDAASRQAAQEFKEMSVSLKATNKKLDAMFAKIEKIRGGGEA